MMDYCGYKIEITSDQLGTVIGTVKSYNENQINLTDATNNGRSVPEELFSVQKRFISNLKILSTTRISCSSSQSSRDLRLEKLRNIPGTYTTCVCDHSPPRVAETAPSQLKANQGTDKSLKKLSGSKESGGLPRTSSSGATGYWHSRSNSSEVLNSELPSGFESDSATSKLQGSNQKRIKTRAKHSASTGNGWDSLRIEDFIDSDFDFEANLALFDKQAFYEKTVSKEGDGGKKVLHLGNFFPDGEKILIEGPNGIGFEPVSECTIKMLTPSKAPESPGCMSTVWCSPSGHKVPFLAPDVHERILYFLATGQDSENLFAPLSMGLTWSRLIEMTGLALVNGILTFLKQPPSRIPNRPNQKNQPAHQQHQSARPPLRALVLPGRRNMPGASAVNIARHLANRGVACVLLYAPSHQSTDDSSFFPAYDTELALAQTLAPRATNLFSVDADEDDVDDEEEDEDDSMLDNSEGELTSPAGRMWISRIPGLTVISKASGITHRPTNALIDILVLGQPLEQYPTEVRQWLDSHKAICLAVQLGKLRVPLKADSVGPSQALKTWVVQLGMPVLAPAQVPESVEVRLVDVGMSRSIVSRVTGNLRFLPPPALFDSTPCIPLQEKGTS